MEEPSLIPGRISLVLFTQKWIVINMIEKEGKDRQHGEGHRTGLANTGPESVRPEGSGTKRKRVAS
jgi:hypothetical protein